MTKNVLRKVHLFILCTIIASLMAACSGIEAKSAYEYQIPAEIGDGWKTASLREADLDSRKLTAMMEDIQDGGFENLHSLMIVKDGRLVFEEYFRGHNPQSIDYVASVTKSVTSILVGIAMDRGFIYGSHQYLVELLPSYRDILNADPLKQKLQLWHILTMTSGLEWDEDTFPYGDARNDATMMENSPNAVRFVLDRPVVREPGKQFQYCACNSMLLSAILEEATGMTAAEFGKLYLFEPLGISQYQWGSYADGHTHTDGGLSLRPRDMAKIGQLMLNNGQWNGIQIVSEAWIAESIQARTTVGLGIQYGYQWWRENQPILLETVEPYFAAGFGGQLINIYPDQKMIIIVTSDTSNHNENASRIRFLQTTYLLPAVVPAKLSKVLLWSWYLLSAGGLVFLILEIGKGKLRGFGWSVAWLLIGVLLGPLGLAAYLLSYRNQQTMKSSGWKALGIAAFLAVGNICGIILLSVYQHFLLPDGSVVLLVFPGSILVSWLAFIAPLATFTKGMRFWKSLRQTLLTALIASCFTLVGILPVLVLVSIRWPDFGLASSLFWFMMTICSIAGTVIVYPFSLWMARRNLDFWPFKRVAEHEIGLAGFDRRLPTLRNAWGALLLGLILLIAILGFSAVILS